MNYMVCIDDTDMPGTRGTGWLVEDLCNILAAEKLAATSAISRHQLFVHNDIPYTSHNSAMGFEMTLEPQNYDAVMSLFRTFLETRTEKGSDPGLCVVQLSDSLDGESLAAFGKAAKSRVLTKLDAYSLAARTGVHLTEHGGTGQGVVGALAGIGLRLSGNDGRYRGWYHLGRPGDIISVAALCEYPFVDALVTCDGHDLALDARVRMGSEKTKTVRMGYRQVIVVAPCNDTACPGIAYRTITKKEAKQY
ncbi:hypothetical protein [Desulfotignum phosphitoxidans]|uniref:tRNA(Ile2) 2-agmatinylcytidine synthetase n=1 Tax=Desulfotignum phosphitoxidans DSM 13687 TaxID=1286635 RepID=S0G398_9BACT|nr:hypothetical protein [Desulfotignum phosphitoxidans]EMS78226.1 hypothetical protein Dpo_9c00580 [Desulfotignum phosphitoxidans DSM 13687]